MTDPTAADLAKAVDDAKAKVTEANQAVTDAETARDAAIDDLDAAVKALADQYGLVVPAAAGSTTPSGAVAFKDADLIGFLNKADDWSKRADVADSLSGVTAENKNATREAVGLRLVALAKADNPKVVSNGKTKALRRWASAEHAAEWTARDEAK